MEPNPRLAHAGYLIAAFLGVAPLVDAVLPYIPPHFGDAKWRFTVLGVVSNVILIPLLALFVALVVTRFDVNRRRPARVVGVIAAVFAALLAICLVGFAVSYFSVTSAADPRVRHTAAVISSTAIAKYCVELVAAVLVAHAARVGSADDRVLRAEPVPGPLPGR